MMSQASTTLTAITLISGEPMASTPQVISKIAQTMDQVETLRTTSAEAGVAMGGLHERNAGSLSQNGRGKTDGSRKEADTMPGARGSIHSAECKAKGR